MPLSVVQVVGNVVVGGAERHVLDLVVGLRAAGADVAVICPRPGPLTTWLDRHGVEYVCIEMVRPRPGDEFALDWPAVEQMAAWLRRRRPQVVHSHLYPAHLHASLAAREAGVPAVVHTALTLDVRPGDVLLGRLGAAHTSALSAAVADTRRSAGLPPDQITLIHPGIGTEHFEPDPAATAALRAVLRLRPGPVIGTVARLVPEKGVDLLIAALPPVVRAHPSVQVLIAGDGPERGALERVAADLAVAPAVRFLGTRDDIAVLNNLLDVFVLPSRQEALGLALVEAMAAGRAVVATRIGGMPEVVDDGESRVLVPPDDPPALAQALLGLLADGERRRALGAAARATVARRFTRERMVAGTLALYERLLAPRVLPGAWPGR
jgi:glycosyltransferase involved in cell wall biosynthesis